MAEIDIKMLQQLARELTATPRLQDAAALAGVGLQLPLVQLRRRAVQREGLRQAAQGNAAGAARQKAVLEQLLARETALGDEYARRTGPQVELGKGEAALAGRVTRKAVPLAGIELVALDTQGELRARTCTSADGRYALALPADTELLLALRSNGKVCWRDTDGNAYPEGARAVRNIETGDQLPPCGGDGDIPPPGTDTTVQMPQLVGQKLEAAARQITALNLKLLAVRERPDDRVGLVIEQDPKAGAKVAPGADVVLVVGVAKPSDTDGGGLTGNAGGNTAGSVGALKGLTLTAALDKLKADGLSVASVRLVPGTNANASASATVQQARPGTDGRSVHIDLALPATPEAEVVVAATLMAAAPEGRAIGLDSPAAAAKWLALAKIDSFPELARVAAFDDAALRKRLALEARAKVALQRSALLVAVSVMVRG